MVLSQAKGDRGNAVGSSERSRVIDLASRLLGSSVLAQVAVFGALAFAATRTSVEDFARFGLVGAIASVLSSCNTLAAESRLALVPKPDAFALNRAGWTAAVTSTMLLVVTGFACWRSGQDLGLQLIFGAGVGGTMGLNQMLTGVVLRQQRQSLLAVNRLVQGLANAVLILLLFALGADPFVGLSAAWLLSTILGNMVLASAASDFRRAMRCARRQDWDTWWREVRVQPVSNLVGSLVGALPMMVLTAVGANHVAGAWALVSRFLGPVVTTASATLQPIFYGHGAAQLRSGQLREFQRYYSMWVRRLMYASLVFLPGLLVAVVFIIPLLGQHWDVARNVAVAACVNFTGFFICLPLSQTLVMLGKVDLLLRWTIARLAICAVPLALIGVIGPWGALTGWAFAQAGTFLWQLKLSSGSISAQLDTAN